MRLAPAYAGQSVTWHPRTAGAMSDMTPEPTMGHAVVARGKPAWRDRIDRELAAAERQRQARMQGGIDWSVCLVPGCGERPSHTDRDRDPSRTLPLCVEHMLVVWQRVQRVKGESVYIEANDALIERESERQAAIRDAERARFKSRQDGHIYFVRANGLVKVGWSRQVRERLRAYGPLAEVLCIYPGTRQDETNLHRQLRPALRRGREWYDDCDVIAAFVSKAIAEHGPPVVEDHWTKPKDEMVKPRKRS